MNLLWGLVGLGIWIGIVVALLGNHLSVELRVIRQGLNGLWKSLQTIEESLELINERRDAIENHVSAIEDSVSDLKCEIEILNNK